MIVRLMGEGQYYLDDPAAAELNHLDTDLERAIDAGDYQKFVAVLQAMHAYVHEHGTTLQADDLTASDAILPPPDAKMSDVLQLVTDTGLIPG